MASGGTQFALGPWRDPTSAERELAKALAGHRRHARRGGLGGERAGHRLRKSLASGAAASGPLTAVGTESDARAGTAPTSRRRRRAGPAGRGPAPDRGAAWSSWDLPRAGLQDRPGFRRSPHLFPRSRSPGATVPASPPSLPRSTPPLRPCPRRPRVSAARGPRWSRRAAVSPPTRRSDSGPGNVGPEVPLRVWPRPRSSPRPYTLPLR